MNATVLLCGTCRIIFNKNKIFEHDNITFIQQPINYSTSFNEVINNLEYLTNEKNINNMNTDMIKYTSRYNTHGKIFYDKKIDMENTICVIEICSKKYNKYGSNIIPYNDRNLDIVAEKRIENTQTKLEYIINNYKFKAIILIPPIIFKLDLPPEVVSLRNQLFNEIKYVTNKSKNVFIFDWNNYFSRSSFSDQYHITDDCKTLLFEKLNKFISDNVFGDTK